MKAVMHRLRFWQHLLFGRGERGPHVHRDRGDLLLLGHTQAVWQERFGRFQGAAFHHVQNTFAEAVSEDSDVRTVM